MRSNVENGYLLNSVELEQHCTLIACRNNNSNAMKKQILDAKKKHMMQIQLQDNSHKHAQRK